MLKITNRRKVRSDKYPLAIIAPPVGSGVKTADDIPWPLFNRQITERWLADMGFPGLDKFTCLPSSIGKGNDAKQVVAYTIDYLNKATKNGELAGAICMGRGAFKAVFGFGRNPSMTLLAGAVVTVTEINSMKLFVFPDLPTEPANPDDYKQKRFLQQLQRQLALRIVPTFREFLAKYTP